MLKISTIQLQFMFPQGTLAHLAPDPKGIGLLVPLLTKHSLLPSISEIIKLQPDGPKKAPSLDLISSDKSWLIDLSPDRIRIELQNQTKTNLSTLSDSKDEVEFLRKSCTKAISALSDLIDIAPAKANRLALLVNGSSKSKQEVEFEPPESRIEFYKKHGTVEWSSRRLARIEKNIGSTKEVLNIITDLSSTAADNHPDKESRRKYAFDINTWQANTELRFDVDNLRSFTDVAVELVLEIGGQIADLS